MAICPVTPTVTYPITEMEVAHIMGQKHKTNVPAIRVLISSLYFTTLSKHNKCNNKRTDKLAVLIFRSLKYGSMNNKQCS